MNSEMLGILLGVLFCLLSAAFDVAVGNLTQYLNPMLIGLYCFCSSFLLFSSSKLITDKCNFIQKVRTNLALVLLLNLSVLMTWAGLFYALKFLEPAVVGILSVAFGPSLTLLIGLFIDKNTKVANYDKIISWLVLVTVFITLSNSFRGYSGVIKTTSLDRLFGILSVVICSIGTVSYTFISKRLNKLNWQGTDLLAVRNGLMCIVAFMIVYNHGISLNVGNYIIPILLLVTLGHIIPIYLIQKSIMMISALQISFVLLSLPIFTIMFQYLDHRILFSVSTLISVALIIALMSASIIIKIFTAIPANEF